MVRKASVSAPEKKKRKSMSGSPISPRGDDMRKIFDELCKPGNDEGAIAMLSDLNLSVTSEELSDIREKSSKEGQLDFDLFKEVVLVFIEKAEEEGGGGRAGEMKRSQSMKAKGGLDPAAMQRLNEPIPKGKETVRVVVRVRPFMPYEFKKARDTNTPIEPVVFMTNKECQLLDPEKGDVQHSFKFDQCFWSIPEEQFPHDMDVATNSSVYEYTGIPAVQHAFTGFNTCIFAYGQTGSGKTHSMLGAPDDPGVAPRLVNQLFGRINELKAKGEKTKFEVRVSFLEIYNEKVMDLLMNAPVPDAGEGNEEDQAAARRAKKAADKKRKSMAGENTSYRECKVRFSPDKGTFVEGITRLMTTNAEDTMRSMENGTKYRAVASHALNNQSSRSHAIFQLCLKQTFILGTTRVSTINIVDLAGSERIKMTNASGSVLDEAKKINQSLSTLRRVIDTLIENSKTRGKKIPPYRESMLTWVLKDSLGGNSKTVMLAAISPHVSNQEDTLNTLRYALKAKSIVLHAHVNEEQTASMVSALKKELEQLKQRMVSGEGYERPEELQQAIEEMKQVEKEAEEFKSKAETEIRVKEAQFKNEKKKGFAAIFKNAFAVERKRMDTEAILHQKNAEMDELRLELEAARKEMEVIKERAAEKLQTEKVRAQKDNDTIEELSEELQQSTKREEELKSSLALSRMQTRKAEIQGDSVHDQVTNLKQEIARLSNYSKEEVERLKGENERLGNVEKENTKIRHDLADQENEIMKLQRRIDQLERELQLARSRVDTLQDEKKDVTSELNNVQFQNTRKQEEMQKMRVESERELHILQVEVDQKESLVKCMRDELRQMRGELDTAMDEKRKAEESMSTMRSQASKTHTHLVLNANELEEQRSRIGELERSNSQTRQELDSAQSQLSALGGRDGSLGGHGSPSRSVAGGFATAGHSGHDLKGYMEDRFFPKGDKRQSDMSRTSPMDACAAGERVWVNNGYVYAPTPHRSPRRSNTPSLSSEANSPRIRAGSRGGSVRGSSSPAHHSPNSVHGLRR